MDFSISEEQQDIQKLANQILVDQVTVDDLKKYDDAAEVRFDQALWAQLAESGLLGIAIKSDFGGMEFGFSEAALFIEECGNVLAPVPVLPGVVSAMTLQKFLGGDKKDLLEAFVAGKQVFSIAVNEPGIDDPYQPQTEFANGKLNGVKQGVAFAEQANHILVVASEAGENGVYLVDANDQAMSKSPMKTTAYEPQAWIEFSNTPAEKVGGADAAKYLLEHLITATCAYQSGVVEQMIKLTASYTSEREQFGVKIATFQAVGQRAASCYIDAKCLKLVTQNAVSLLDEGLEASTAVNVAKAWCGDAGHRISYAAQHLHGGMGVDRDYPLWRFALWAKQNELTLGNTSYHLDALGDAIAAGDWYIDG